MNAALNENKERKLDFDTQLDDLNKYFNDDIDKAHRFKTLLATPLIPTKPEMYILGMSERSAKLAGRRGLPFVIAKMGQSSSAIEEVINVYKMSLHVGMEDIGNRLAMAIIVLLVGHLMEV